MNYVSVNFWAHNPKEEQPAWYTVGSYTFGKALEIIHDPASYRLLETEQFMIVSQQTGEIIAQTEIQKGEIVETYCTIYFETTQIDPNGETVKTPHENLEDAAKYAEENNIKSIHLVGGDWADYEKCGSCGKWHDTRALENGTCEYCANLI